MTADVRRAEPEQVPDSHLLRRLERAVGGAARLRVIVLLAAILALDSADQATIGASAVQLKRALHIGNFDLGLLATVSSAIGALATLPMGVLVDRINRVRLITVSIVLWSLAMAVSGAATSFGMLLTVRLALGLVTAAAGPVVASLTGDFFDASDRGRVYGFILTGELIGTGIGLLVSGNIASGLSWRYAFWVLALPGIVLAWAINRWLAEPLRGGASRLPPETGEATDEAAAEATAPSRLRQEIEAQHVQPHQGRILRDDPSERSLWWATKYVLSIRTNVTLIVASVLGYFFFAGVRTFGVVFVRGRFHLPQGTATLLLAFIGAGAVIGVLVFGRLGDYLIDRHRLAARPEVAGLAYVIAVVCFLPGLLASSVWAGGILFFLGAIGLGGANAPLDAARLDLVHYRMWGRAESVRSTLRTALQAAAPLLFGFVASQFGGTDAGVGQPAATQPTGAVGLDRTFLIMLVPLLVSGLVTLLLARRTYPRDVATALAAEPAEPSPAKA